MPENTSNKWKAVLFDMDGTITDTERIYNHFWNSCARELGMNDFTYQDSLDLRSLNHEDSAKLMEERHHGSVDYDTLHKAVAEHVRDYLSDHEIPLKPGINEILDACHEKGIRAVVVTATNLRSARKRLADAGLLPYFDDVVSAHEAKRGKPHPDPYLLAASRIGLLPSECLAVEDSPNGCTSAIKAGMNTVMVPDLTEPDPELKKRLYAVAPSLSDIISLL